jgi:hypothetical protein
MDITPLFLNIMKKMYRVPCIGYFFSSNKPNNGTLRATLPDGSLVMLLMKMLLIFTVSSLKN